MDPESQASLPQDLQCCIPDASEAPDELRCAFDAPDELCPTLDAPDKLCCTPDAQDDSGSDTSDVIPMQATVEKLSTPSVPSVSNIEQVADHADDISSKGAVPKSKGSKVSREAIKRRYYRRTETIFAKLAALKTQTGCSGFVVLCSPDGKDFLYGGDENLTERFANNRPLIDTVPTKKNSSRVCMSKVMDKIVKKGKTGKIGELVLETPEKDPQSFAAAQKEALSSVFIDGSGSKPVPATQKMVIRGTQKPNPKRKLESIYGQRKVSGKKGRKEEE